MEHLDRSISATLEAIGAEVKQQGSEFKLDEEAILDNGSMLTISWESRETQLALCDEAIQTAKDDRVFLTEEDLVVPEGYAGTLYFNIDADYPADERFLLRTSGSLDISSSPNVPTRISHGECQLVSREQIKLNRLREAILESDETDTVADILHNPRTPEELFKGLHPDQTEALFLGAIEGESAIQIDDLEALYRYLNQVSHERRFS